VLVGASASDAQRSEVPRRHSAWAELESALAQRGISRDTTSLIKAAREHPEAGVRWIAVEILGVRGERSATVALREVLAKDSDGLIRETAAVALVRLGDVEGAAALKRFMDSAANRERQIFLAARLAESGDSSGYRYVVEASRSTDARVRYLSVAALLSFVTLAKSAAATSLDPVDRLLALARDQDAKIRMESIQHLAIAIGRGAGAEPIVALLQDLLKTDADPQVREAARVALLSSR
jgi:HEAT repeat protein